MRLSAWRIAKSSGLLVFVAVVGVHLKWGLPAFEPKPVVMPAPVFNTVPDQLSSILLTQRNLMQRLLGHDAKLVMDNCAWQTRDSVRLVFLDAFDEGNFTVLVTSRGKGAVATWHQFRFSPPPPPPGASGRDRREADSPPEDLTFSVQGEVVRAVSPAEWRSLQAAVREPAWTQQPYNPLGQLDGWNMFIEACVDRHYYLIGGLSPEPEGDSAFEQIVRRVHLAAGGVYPYPFPAHTH